MDKVFHFLLKDLHLPSVPLEPTQADMLKNELMKRYFPHTPELPDLLYLQKANGVGILHLDEKKDWEKCLSILKQQEIIIFFDRDQGKSDRLFFSFPPSEQLEDLLGEIQLVNIYFTNAVGDFLICYSEFEHLYVWGTARTWFL